MNTSPLHFASTQNVSDSTWEEPRATSAGHSLLLGSEEEELQAMLKELLAAFPTQTKESQSSLEYLRPFFLALFVLTAVACDLHHPLFVSVAQVGSTVGEMVEQVATAQGLFVNDDMNDIVLLF